MGFVHLSGIQLVEKFPVQLCSLQYNEDEHNDDDDVDESDDGDHDDDVDESDDGDHDDDDFDVDNFADDACASCSPA